MSSDELTGWLALFGVHEEEAEYRRHQRESGDGIVEVHGRDDGEDDEDDDSDDLTNGSETE